MKSHHDSGEPSRKHKHQHNPKHQHAGKSEDQQKPEEPIKKQEPNFQPSGILLEFYNSKNGVSLKFHEPEEAHPPVQEWRIYPFKDQEPLPPIILKESCYLVGKDERVCDILCENTSISRQHAVIQFRKRYKLKIDGEYEEKIKPYIMDLVSTNGTFLNGERVEAERYYELIDRDMVKFGHSEREYVFVNSSQ